jgi:hypothetical protein
MKTLTRAPNGRPFWLELKCSRALLHDVELGRVMWRDCDDEQRRQAQRALTAKDALAFGSVVIDGTADYVEQERKAA